MTRIDDEARREAARERLRARQARREAAGGAKSSRLPFMKPSNSRTASRNDESSQMPNSLSRRFRKPPKDTGAEFEGESSFDTTFESYDSSILVHENEQTFTEQREDNSTYNEGTLSLADFENNHVPELRNGRVVERLHDVYTPMHAQAYEFADDDSVSEEEGWPDDYRFDEPRSLPDKVIGFFGEIAGGITAVLQSAFLAVASVIESVRDRFGTRGLIIPVVVLLLLLVLLFQSCSSAPTNEANQNPDIATTENNVDSSADSNPSTEQTALATIADNDAAA